MEQQFTKYERARILGARALQIAMDAPLLIKIPEEKLKEMRYDALKLAAYELNEKILPITINRPKPRKRSDKLSAVKEVKSSEEELLAKTKEVEKEIAEDANQYGLVNEGDIDDDSLSHESESTDK